MVVNMNSAVRINIIRVFLLIFVLLESLLLAILVRRFEASAEELFAIETLEMFVSAGAEGLLAECGECPAGLGSGKTVGTPPTAEH